MALTDEYKFGFPYERLYLQTRVKRNGDVKLHLDEGEVVRLFPLTYPRVISRLAGTLRQEAQPLLQSEDHAHLRELQRPFWGQLLRQEV